MFVLFVLVYNKIENSPPQSIKDRLEACLKAWQLFLTTPSTPNWVFSQTEIFFLRIQLPSTRNPKKEVFKYAHQDGDFENGDLSYSCGRAKTEVFKYDDVMPRFGARSSAHTIRKRYVWMQIF